jgi:hypothetical protein
LFALGVLSALLKLCIVFFFWEKALMIKEKDMIKPLAVMLIIAAFTFALVVFGLLQSSVRIVGRGTVKAVGVGIYWDSNCTNTVSFIDWGMVEPGSMNNVTVYVRNEGNVAANISLATENWNPINASDYLALSWIYDGRQLSPQEVIPATLTLTVSSSVQGIESFSFDIIMSISG